MQEGMSFSHPHFYKFCHALKDGQTLDKHPEAFQKESRKGGVGKENQMEQIENKKQSG